MIITRRGYARAGLIGNPSDGYYGKTIAIIIKNFCAEIRLFETPELEIEFAKQDHTIFKSLEGLVEDVKYYGYYGGIRLIKAAIKRFYDYTVSSGIKLDQKNFTIQYSSNVPIMVGLAGSSAIITGTFRSLMEFYEVQIPKAVLPTLMMEVETKELKIPAGLQDRVIQVYGGCCYMDFDYQHMCDYGYGTYKSLPVENLPDLFVAYREELSEGTEVLHSDLRERFNRGEDNVVLAMKEFGKLTDAFAKALNKKDSKEMHSLINANFDLRASVCSISRDNWEMINIARNIGASAKFAGSGGAIVGMYDTPEMYITLEEEYRRHGIQILKPEIKPFNRQFM